MQKSSGVAFSQLTWLSSHHGLLNRTAGLPKHHTYHLLYRGATSCYVTDNADLILYRDALDMLCNKICGAIHKLSVFAQQHASLPCLAYTHLQPVSMVPRCDYSSAHAVIPGTIDHGWQARMSLDSGSSDGPEEHREGS